MLNKKIFLVLIVLLVCNVVGAQTPVEVFVGNKKSTIDIMFFNFFKQRSDSSSRWLFFNRNRVGVDYAMTKTTFLPQFGFTEAISYNHAKMKGVAPVAVVQILNRGVFPKVGVQYAKVVKKYTIFSWLVCETLKKPYIDYFLLARYTPKITKKVNLFTQAELVNNFAIHPEKLFSFTQRFRIGVKLKFIQLGAAIDFTTTGRNKFIFTSNTGLFLRYEF